MVVKKYKGDDFCASRAKDILKFEKGFDEFGRGTNSKAMIKAEEGTYTQELNGIFKRVQDIANNYPLVKQIIPFVRPPVNLMFNVVDRTPIGFIGRNL